MLTHLIRNNAHNSEVFLSIIYDNNNPVGIKKSASTLNPIKRLKNEYNGICWYQKNSNLSYNIEDIIDLEDYFSISLQYIDGFKARFSDGFVINYEYIKKALMAYCEIWSSSSSTRVVHGDFSIDNLLITSNGVVIIDWEHFTQNSIPVGFDALNLIYEQIFVCLLKENYLPDNVIENILGLLLYLKNSLCLSHEYWDKPLSTARSYMDKNSDIWGKQIVKLPLFKFSEKQVNYLDNNLFLI